jgi:hypothetical protein
MQHLAHVPPRRHYNMQHCHLLRCHSITRHRCLPHCNSGMLRRCCLSCRHGITRRCCPPCYYSDAWHCCSHAAMMIGSDIFSLTTTGICGFVFRRATLVVGILGSHCATSVKHSNQPKEGCVAKDSSNRGKATDNNQPVQQKDKRATQHSNSATTAM